MFFPLTQLPRELLDIIMGLLGTQDIVNLVECMPYMISKQAYRSAFHDPRQFAHYNLELFEKRARARFYVNGQPLNTGIVVEAGLYFGSPLYLSSKGSVISCGEKVVIATAKADDYDKNRSDSQIGHTESPTELWYRVMEKPWLDLDCSIGPVDDQFAKDSNELFERKSVRFSRFHANDTLCLYDENGWVWMDIERWKSSQHDLRWAPIAFVDGVTGTCFSKGIVDVIAYPCFHTLALLVHGKGVFTSDSKVFRVEYPNGYRSGIWCFDDHACRIEVSFVPGTEGAQQIGLLGSVIVCLWPNGTISAFKRSQDDDDDDDNYLDLVPKLNKYGPFVLLEVMPSQLILVTRNGLVITTKDGRVRVIDDFLGLQVCSAAICIGCYYVLTNEGSAYSWGWEMPDVCVLGLSNSIKVKRNEYGSRTVDRPTKIELPGEAYALCVDNTLLGFLMSEQSKCNIVGVNPLD